MLYVYAPDQGDLYASLLRAALPEWSVAAWPAPVDPAAVTHVAAWAPPPGFFAPFGQLRTVFNLGAGVDALLTRDDLPASVDIVRLTDAGMAAQMTEYCLYGVLHWQREMDAYRRQQAEGVWLQRQTRLRADVRVGILGLGELGGRVARDLVGMGYRVGGWSRRRRELDGVVCRHGDDGLNETLASSDVVFCVLPATAATRHLLDAARLACLPEGAALINAGRGSLIDEAALLARLDDGGLRFAMLDVFSEEPLPAGHPFWRHPRVIMTPHVAADTVAEEAVRQIAARLGGGDGGAAPAGRIDRQRGY
ncbi:2-hydroxyacid dehydrogenase [Propionivibrio dicarboxylicus]|uniref:Glyoxylate/hydroxypyruvate reductase A n=1 Tax=Propionivibrio dicarboxylicus TaxID=83767 RepID=A0A1G8JH62_9RHOO|nr:glyoxylate/hydroxypyruvate reductase A [Propionivibrio dicarboxylicus]SDI30619.1 glyoxylate/hydroxypyruvate reductase A [Propionivibrio dicarboxylicus]